ncbi:MAG: MoaD/ThiS family protein [Planctomycetia bacterium]|nr:MoaD/ThiS family protein [Planctomycetia bacterium]
MSITVEFFGIPRQRAGVAVAVCPGERLGDVLRDLAGRFPAFAETCLDLGSSGSRLRAGFVANVNGERFLSDPAATLKPGDSLLILGADAGG